MKKRERKRQRKEGVAERDKESKIPTSPFILLSSLVLILHETNTITYRITHTDINL